MDRLLTENNALVIKSLNADLRAVSADLAAAVEVIHRQDTALFEFQANLAAAENRVKALEAENARLRKALEAVERNAPSTAPQQPSLIDYAACWAFWVAGNVAHEALQAKEAE